jgi:hypothetical protein
LPRREGIQKKLDVRKLKRKCNSRVRKGLSQVRYAWGRMKSMYLNETYKIEPPIDGIRRAESKTRKAPAISKPNAKQSPRRKVKKLASSFALNPR